MWRKVESLEAALALAEKMKADGAATLFRGQTRSWPILSSFSRRSPAEREVSKERFAGFANWVKRVPALATIAGHDDMLLAVAQHYGIPTNLVDFSTEPRVAAFFATHEAGPPTPDEEDVSCIVCLDPEELEEVGLALRAVRPQMYEVKKITVDVPDLWRLQAQRGVFLDYPYDESFERTVFGFDRIVFPTERNPVALARLMPAQDIYPSQKSDLEMLLDQFFMLEKMKEGNRALRREGAWTIRSLESVVDGVEAECFGPAGLPAHNSWDQQRLTKWQQPTNEAWVPLSTAPALLIHFPAAEKTTVTRVRNLKEQIGGLLLGHSSLFGGPFRWELVGFPGDPGRVTRGLELLWDGLRRWPYPLADVAEGLATVVEFGALVAAKPDARVYPFVAEELAGQCLGKVIEVEIAIEDGSYTRGYASQDRLREAVRDDLDSFLNDEWRGRFVDATNVLQVANNPRSAFVFERLVSVFCTQIAPTQTVLRDERTGKARLYNLARATRVGLP